MGGTEGVVMAGRGYHARSGACAWPGTDGDAARIDDGSAALGPTTTRH